MLLLLFTFIVCVALAGCTLQDRIEEYSSDKVQNRQQAVERGYEIGFIGLEKGGTDEKKK